MRIVNKIDNNIDINRFKFRIGNSIKFQFQVLKLSEASDKRWKVFTEKRWTWFDFISHTQRVSLVKWSDIENFRTLSLKVFQVITTSDSEALTRASEVLANSKTILFFKEQRTTEHCDCKLKHLNASKCYKRIPKFAFRIQTLRS